MAKKIVVAIGSDHAGFRLKEFVKKLLEKKGFHVADQGVFSPESADYPDYAQKVACAIQCRSARFGVLVCGTGVGMCITANKFKGIRAAHCPSPTTARQAREHIDANVLVLASKYTPRKKTISIVSTFFSTKFSGVLRHARRIKKIRAIEGK